jgi:SAM-dependent methyltransferase
MSTDTEWERWGAKDPYFGVLTDPRFRSQALNEQALADFFQSGEAHVNHVLAMCQRMGGDPPFQPASVLDFGCGVGRLVIPFARRVPRVVGLDVSPSMLAEARRNCDARGASAVALLPSNDALSEVPGQFDLVHSCIVLQHIEVERGRRLFERLVHKISPGGFGALHVTFGLTTWASTFGQQPPPPPPPPPSRSWPLPGMSLARAVRRYLRGLRPSAASSPPLDAPEDSQDQDPEMQMNCYNMSELMFVVQQAGVQQMHLELTDHGGAIGAFLIFRRPA